MKPFFILFILLGFVNVLQAQTSTVNYAYSTDDFVNPERGMYRYSETRSDNYTPLDSATIAGYRLLHTPFSAGYAVYSSLVFRYFFLEDFVNAPISAAYLAQMETDFATARAAGVKLIPRFAYTDSVNDTGCSGGICPPYGDASKSIVLGHLAQLKPILQANYDVILGVQMGLIGIWGENYYTDYFGDASLPPYMLSTSNWADRKEVLDSLLAAVHTDRNVQVRYPQKKQKAIYGLSAPTTSSAMILAEAYTGSDKSRLGFHNDCFLASADDFGTYNDYDNAVSDTANLKPYQAADSKFVLVGGETCAASTFSPCEAQGGMVLTDMKRMHYTYLNSDYNNTVNDAWVGVCMDSIKRSLGYRLALTQATFSNAVSVGNNLSYSFTITNKGFAAPVNQRNVELVLIDQSSGATWEVVLDEDPRYWFTGTHTFSGTACIPECMTAGNYDLALRLSDPTPRLKPNLLFNIRLANTNTWDATTGLNDLNHSLVISAGSNSCGSAPAFRKNNYWVGNSTGDWHASIVNWSQGKIPTLCDDVIIPPGHQIVISSSNIGLARSVLVQDGADLAMQNGGELQVVQ